MKSEKEILESGKIWNVIPPFGGWIKLPDCGTCTVVWGRNEDGYEHVSVSPTHKYKIPSWEDMAYLKDVFWDDEEEAYQIMPKKSEYVNIKYNCLHLWKPIGHELGELVERKCQTMGGGMSVTRDETRTNLERVRLMDVDELAHLMDTIEEKLIDDGEFCNQYCKCRTKDGCSRENDDGDVDCLYNNQSAYAEWLRMETLHTGEYV